MTKLYRNQLILLKKNYKSLLLFVFFLTALFNVHAQDIIKVSESKADEVLSGLFENSANISETELYQKYLEAGYISESSGNLSKAAGYFEQASLAVSGNKDYESLYKSAVLNAEIADYHKSESQLKIIMNFTEDLNLSQKCRTLLSRVYFLRGEDQESVDMIEDVFSRDDIPLEAVFWLDELSKAADSSLNKINGIISRNMDKINNIAELVQFTDFPSPERLLGFFRINPEQEFVTVSDQAENKVEIIESETESAVDDENTISIQLGSFGVEKNADELLKKLLAEGFQVKLSEKTVNSKIYHVVLMPAIPAEELQDMVIKLKENGYEAYPIY